MTKVKTPLGVWVTPVLIAGLTIALVLALGLSAQKLLWDYAIREASADHLDALDRDAFLIEARLRGRANDMFFLKRVAEEELARNPNATPVSDNFRSAVTTMMLARSQYDQVRLLDLSGHEVFRYNWKGGAQPLEEVAANALQDKSDRPYYRETLEASPDAVVFSSLDLNLEQGQVERPFKPVLRTSGQIVGPDGKPRALLVLNFLGDQLLRELRGDSVKHRQNMLLNPDGFWLVGPTPESEWGFMFPERAGENLKKADPVLWGKITAAKSGWFDANGNLYCFQNIDPIGSTSDYPPLRLPVKDGERLRWTLLTMVPNAAVWQNVKTIRKGIWATSAAAIVLLVPLTCFGYVSRQRRRRADWEVREARELLDNVIHTSLHGITVMKAVRDAGGHIVDLKLILSNKSASHLLGQDLALAQREGRTMLQDHPEAREDGTYDRFYQVVETGEPVVFENHYKSGDVQRWLSVRAAKREDGLVATFVDITNRVEAEEKLRQSELLLRLAGKMSKVGGWTVEYPRRKVRWTEEVYHIHEVPLDYYPTMNEGIDFYAPEYKEIVNQAFESCIREGTPFDLEVELITAKGRRIWVRNMGQAEFKDGHLLCLLGTFQDITAAKKALLLEQDLKREAQAAERAKSEFLAMMSHEIRTPMNGVIGLTSLLLETRMDSEQHNLAETIRASAESLLGLINDILDFSKIEAGKLSFEELDFDLRKVVEDVLEMMAGQALTKGIELGGGVDPEMVTRLRGDAGRVQQVLTNLIGNAIKFTKSGEVSVAVSAETQTDTEVLVRFEIKDTGIGIAPEAQPQLFQPFVQGDGSTSRKFGGTGLGLAICKRLAESMNGEIGVESIPDKGSTFWVTLRFSRQAGAGAEQRNAHEFADTRVLIVDDNETSRLYLHKQIAAWRMRGKCASSGEEALLLLRQAAAEKLPYQVAIVDLQMADMDGLALLRKIKADPLLGTTRLIMLTPFGKPIPSEELEAVNVAGCCVKPVRQSALFDCIVQVLTYSETNGSSRKPELFTRSSVPVQQHRERILLAEDNVVNQQVAMGNLRKLGYTADIAVNGMEVLNAVEGKRYDIILMDCQMPELDGYEVTKEIRRREKNGRHIWIIAMTANAMVGDREKCLAAGMDDYLSKPLRRADLRIALEGGVARPANPLDEEAMRNLMVIGEDEFAELIDLFITSAPATMADMRRACDRANPVEIAFAAHTLKGSCGNLGKIPLYEICSEIELAGRNNNINGIDDLVASAEKEFSRLIEALKSRKLKTPA